MRTRILLFLLSCIMVFGCTRQDRQVKTAKNKFCTPSHPCVTVHTVALDGKTCPDVLRLGSQDVVEFANRSNRRVNVFGLDNRGRPKPPNDTLTDVRLSGKKLIRLTADDTLGYLQVSVNPFKGKEDTLVFNYSVRYLGPGGMLCGSPPDSSVMQQILMSVPPSMFVGPDTL